MENKNNNKLIFVLIIIIFIIVLAMILIFALKNKNSSNNRVSEAEQIVKNSADLNITYLSEEETDNYDSYSAEINLNDLATSGNGVSVSNSTITITQEGIYHFTGTADDANIVVNANDTALVVLVFDNAQITSSKTAVITGVEAEEIIVNLKSGTENTFTDGNSYSEFIEDDEPNATVFSKTDLAITGTGKLTVNANYNDAIASKDTLKVINATINVVAKDDGIRGKDALIIKNANITINSEGAGLKATNTDEDKGYIYIESGDLNINSTGDAVHSDNYIVIDGGNIEISAGDDAIHAETSVLINNGKINIAKSYEGIEAPYIEINDGNIDLVASDDGINVNGASSEMMGKNQTQIADTSDRLLLINGGTININSNGDGLDSNASIKITGGTTIVSGSTNGGNGALDYDITCEITGGTLIYYGATGMWQDPNGNTTINTVSFGVSGGAAGDKIELKDSNGNTIANLTTLKTYQKISFTDSKIKNGETYTLYVNGTEVGSIESTGTVSSNSQDSGMGGFNGGGMQKGNMQKGEMQINQSENFEMQEGQSGMPMNKGNRNR